jgi:hypothetical protein
MAHTPAACGKGEIQSGLGAPTGIRSSGVSVSLGEPSVSYLVASVPASTVPAGRAAGGRPYPAFWKVASGIFFSRAMSGSPLDSDSL